jgi:glutamate 5-kinase
VPRSKRLKKVKRIVVKIGTSNITEDGAISPRRIAELSADIISLIRSGYQAVVVTSGAISAGADAMKRNRENLTIPEKQALASIGQTILMNEYGSCFSGAGIPVGQILLTEDDVKNRLRFINARHTFNSLMDMGVVPIVNENDSVATGEIRIGDNDTLSAHVANIVEADLLILLSDVDGFYRDLSDPEPVEEITEIDGRIRKMAGGAGSIHGTGGMMTKINAAEIVIKSGEMMVIANGRNKNVLSRIMKGEVLGTLFIGSAESMPSRKRWIAFNEKVKGAIFIDNGAVSAIRDRKKSLLATGITGVEGKFSQGDAVEITDGSGAAIGKGIVNYSAGELKKIKGKKSSEIRDVLGGTFFDEVINRDYMIIF